MLKENNCKPRILYPLKVSFRNEGKNPDIFKGMKTKRISHNQTCPKEMVKKSSLNRNEMRKKKSEGEKEHRKQKYE